MKASILIITYNHEKFIEQAIRSAIDQQTTFDFEIIVGDDFSTDNTRNILLDFQRRYPQKIKLIFPDKNRGIANNFIDVLSNCIGEYVAICEGDDYWTSPLKLEAQIGFLDKNPEYVLSAHSVMVKYQDSGFKEYEYFSTSNDSFSLRDVIKSRLFATNSIVFRRNCFLDWPDWFEKVISTDKALLILLASKGRIKYHKEIMGIYRKHSEGISMYGDRVKIFHSDLFLYNKVNEYFRYEYKNIVNEVIHERYEYILEHYINKNDFINSFKYLIMYILKSIEYKIVKPRDIARKIYYVITPKVLRNFKNIIYRMLVNN